MKKITLHTIAFLFIVSSWGQTVVYIDEDFQSTDISGGDVELERGFARYNYTADIAGGEPNWNNGQTDVEITNSVSANNNSASSQFYAALVGGKQGLLMRGSANFRLAGSGFYFTGLDLTGQTTLYFEFEIWGGPVSGDTDLPATFTDWSVHLNHGNTLNSFSLDDSWFVSGPEVTRDIPFDITNGTTNQTNVTTFDVLDGQWIKISGSINLTGKTLGNFAALQIETSTPTSGGFISGGVPIYALDNVKVTAETTLSNDSFELNNDIKIYPNPVKNVLKIKSKGNLNISNLRLVDILGKTVYASKTLHDIDVSTFAKGLYILKIDSKENGVLSKKVIIE